MQQNRTKPPKVAKTHLSPYNKFMYIQKKSFTVTLKFIISLLSLCSLWYIISQFGPNSFRLFPAWVLALSSVYFLASAIVLVFSAKKFNGKIICPMLEGLLIINFLLMSVMTLASLCYHFYLPELPSQLIVIICIILPLLIIIDWSLFVKKGAWRTISPFYWLALPVCYAAAMIFATQVLPDDADLRFPLEIFNYIEYGILPMLGWMFAIAVLSLAAGYLLYLLDFTLSGQLAQKIVLPHLQVVEVDEDGNIIEENNYKSDQYQKPLAAKTSPSKVSSKGQSHKSSPSQTKAKSTKSNSQPGGNKSKTKKSNKTTAPEIIKVEVEKVNDKIQHKADVTPKSSTKKAQETLKTQRVQGTQKTHETPQPHEAPEPHETPESHEIQETQPNDDTDKKKKSQKDQ